MNILIVGNGFDLSHYLPTKYENFIGVMNKIENWSNNSLYMVFDDLFDKENSFVQRTKSIYQTDKIFISSSAIKDVRQQLEGNVWYKFFSHHLSKIDTWIDFEIEFSHALDLVAKFSESAEETYNLHERLAKFVKCSLATEGAKNLAFKHRTIEKLLLLDILVSKSSLATIEGADINEKYYRKNDVELDIDFNSIIRDLESSLTGFIELFKWYLKEIIHKLEPKKKFYIKNKHFGDDLLILSFNYTSTFSRFYSQNAKVEYVHGSVGKELVLGIPDLKNEFLKKFKNYSFTKYHQKLLKGTDYHFLHENRTIKAMFETKTVGLREINIHIWGHSLAESDENYIREIFTLNTTESIQCCVVVYYFNNDAPQLLNNLLDILGKAIVEEWMKKGWLRFEKNPGIDFGLIEDSELEKEAS